MGLAFLREHPECPYKPRRNSRTWRLLPSFARCYCCPDFEPPPQPSDIDRPFDLLDGWSDKRDEYLWQDGRSHFGNTDEITSRDSDTIPQPHNLCQKCAIMCQISVQWQRCNVWSKLCMPKYFAYSLVTPRDDQVFEHWGSPAELHASAKHGCHLCNIRAHS